MGTFGFIVMFTGIFALAIIATMAFPILWIVWIIAIGAILMKLGESKK